MKTTRKNIGWYEISCNGRKWEVLRSEDGKEWNIGEIKDNGYGFASCDEYEETFWTLRDCKEYVRKAA